MAIGWWGKCMKTLITLLVMAVIGLAWQCHENGNLKRSFDAAKKVTAEQKNAIGMLEDQLAVSGAMARTNETTQVKLRGELIAAGERAVQREETMTRLLNENEELRRWYGDRLPDAVRRLHTRTGCASAGHCLQRLPESELLPDAGKRPGK
jgi:LysB family phage lysis regulatory protein